MAVEEVDPVHADRGGRGPLLRLPPGRHLRAWCVIEAAGVSPGGDEVGHLDTLIHPAGYGARTAEVDIIRMGKNCEGSTDVGQGWSGRREAHSAEPTRVTSPHLAVSYLFRAVRSTPFMIFSQVSATWRPTNVLITAPSRKGPVGVTVATPHPPV
ncbi:hypothetical protein GCM10027452_04750 [Micromonospora halotolerans]